MSFWSDISKAIAPTGEYANLDSATLQSTIQSLLAQQAANGGANADPVFARELEKAGYMGGSSPNLQQMDITDYNYAGPNTAKVNGQPVTYAALGQGFGEYRQDPNVPNEYFSHSSQRDKFSSTGYGIDPSGQYIVMSKPTMTPPPRATSGSFVDFLKDIAPSALIPFAGPLAGSLGGGLAGAAGAGAIVGGGSAALTGGDIGRGALMGGAGGAIGNQLFGASGGNDLAGAEAQAYGAPRMSAAEQIATGPRYVQNVNGVSTDPISFGTAPDYANAGYDIPSDFPEYANAGYDVSNEAYRQPFNLEYGDGMGDPASSAMRAAGAVSPITPGLIAKIAEYTGLSTGAIERLGGAAISSLAGLYGANVVGNAADRAANRLAESNQAATQLQTRMYEDQVARQQPFYQAGVNALGPYTTGIMGTEEDRKAGRPGALVRPFDVNRDYAQSPWYQASLTKKLKDYTNKLGSMGLVDSGPMRRGVLDIAGQAGQEDIMGAYNRYNQDLATQRGAYGNLAGFAPPATAQIGAAGTNYGANVNNLATSTARNYANADLTGAAARQSAYGGAGGAFANALSPNPYTAFLNKQMGVFG